MCVIDKVLLKVTKDIEQRVDMDVIELSGTDQINGFRIFRIHNSGKIDDTTHYLQLHVPRHRHLSLDKQVAFDGGGMKALVVHRFYIVGEIQIEIV